MALWNKVLRVTELPGVSVAIVLIQLACIVPDSTFYYLNILQLSIERAGGRLNKKDGLTRYGDSHVKDKTS